MHLLFSIRHKKIVQACLRLFVCCLSLQPAASALAQTESKNKSDFTTYSLEELMNMDLTTAAKKPQPAYESASAVFVITQEDIRRSGAVNLPEVLRMAPGIEVLRAGPGTFAVSCRGFLGKYANKLLVMIDGRSIYSPTYSGVFWSYNDIPLENIERIEVIRGPGATLWGANAVNGVINIITKKAQDMQGGLGVATVSNQEGYDTLRYGVKLQEKMYLAAYGKYMHFGNAINEKIDDRRQKNFGARLDWEMTDRDKLFVSTQYFEGDEGGRLSRPVLIPPLVKAEVENSAETSGGHFLSRWDHTFSPTSAMSLQMYYNQNFNRGERSTGYRPAQDSNALNNDVARDSTSDIDFQHTFALGSRNSIVWGFDTRYSKIHKQDRDIFFTLKHDTARQKLYSFFMQDEMVLMPELLHLILGSKFEYTSYTQLEIQPSIRLLYTPSQTQTIWAAVSRAARTPSFLENEGRLPVGFIKRGSLFPLSPPGKVEMQGNSDFTSENLIAYEVGHRMQLTPSLSFDTALYYNVYSDLGSFEPSSLQGRQGYFVVPLCSDNKMKGRTYGGEVVANWQVLPQWRLQSTYSYLRMNLKPRTDSQDTNSEYAEELSPENTFTLRSLYSITPSLECDISLYFIDRLERLNNPSHTDLTIRLGWKPLKKFMIEGIGSNLIDNKYKAFRDDIYARGDNRVRRVFYGRITVEF
jgi:iron complex outermembrane recepter protein